MYQKRLFFISAACYLLSSASILPMAAGDISGKTGSAPLALISALIFWLSLIAAIVTHRLLRRLQKFDEKNNPVKEKRQFTKILLSKPSVFFEAGFLISLLLVIILTVLNTQGFIVFIFLFLTLICLELSMLTWKVPDEIRGNKIFNISDK